jgi:histidine triad (HIT) family protein
MARGQIVRQDSECTWCKETWRQWAMHVFRMAQRLSEALRQTDLRCEGVNLFLADGEAAMQEIPHVHLHVFPRFRGDGFGLKFGEHYFHKPDRTQLDSAARKLAGVLRR